VAKRTSELKNGTIRVGKAAELLGVSSDTLRRWEASGKIRTRRSPGGQRLIALADVVRLSGARRAKAEERTAVKQSARNRFEGIITRVEKDRISAVVEVRAGPHRLVSLITAEAAIELDLRPGLAVACVVKATNVVVEVARRGTAAS
jgi:molybdopterin-binding protein